MNLYKLDIFYQVPQRYKLIKHVMFYSNRNEKHFEYLKNIHFLKIYLTYSKRKVSRIRTLKMCILVHCVFCKKLSSECELNVIVYMICSFKAALSHDVIVATTLNNLYKVFKETRGNICTLGHDHV